MADAKKCDRCGKLYEAYKGLRLKSNGTHYNRISFVSKDYYNTYFDLCPDCMRALISFVKEKEADDD